MKQEEALYKELGRITKEKSEWYNSVEMAGSLLEYPSVKIQAKALWLIGEFGLNYPDKMNGYLEKIVGLLSSSNALLRGRAVNALGRIGRADYTLIYPFWEQIMTMANDTDPNVRMLFVWASENIATNSPQLYKEYMDFFSKMLDDASIKVRMEAPEMFRVLAKRTPEFIQPCLSKLKFLSKNDSNRVVHVHTSGALKAYANFRPEFYSKNKVTTIDP